MAKKKKSQASKLKFVSEEQLEEYKNADFQTLLTGLILRSGALQDCEAKKKSSTYLKELASEIREYRKKWEDDHKSEMEEAKNALLALKEARDEAIEEAIADKKDTEGGLNDGIKAMREHISVIVDCMTTHGPVNITT